MLDYDDVNKKIERFQSSLGGTAFQNDTALAIEMIKKNKKAILSRVHPCHRHVKLERAMDIVFDAFPNSDRIAIERALIRIGIPSTKRDVNIIRMIMGFICFCASLALMFYIKPFMFGIFFSLAVCFLLVCVYNLILLHLGLDDE